MARHNLKQKRHDNTDQERKIVNGKIVLYIHVRTIAGDVRFIVGPLEVVCSRHKAEVGPSVEHVHVEGPPGV